MLCTYITFWYLIRDIEIYIYTPLEDTTSDWYAQYFLSTTTPDTMIYGKYVNESDDEFIKKFQPLMLDMV